MVELTLCVRVVQKKLKPSDGREAELGLKGSLIKEQHRTSLKVLLSYFSSHFPSTEMILLEPNPAAHSEAHGQSCFTQFICGISPS